MKIAVLGAGAMGALFGAYLSERNSVWLIDVSASRVDLLEREGVTIIEKSGRKRVFHPHAVTSCKDLPVMDLVIVFVKAMYTLDALEANKALIGPDTYLMTLQNGAGHEAKLLKYAKADRVIIGSTQHNSSITDAGALSHGGSGLTSIGLLEGPFWAIHRTNSGNLLRLRTGVPDQRLGQGPDLEEAVHQYSCQLPHRPSSGSPWIHNLLLLCKERHASPGSRSRDCGQRHGPGL